MGSDCIVKVFSSKYGTKVQKNMDDCRESISEIRIGSLEGSGNDKKQIPKSLNGD